ncbi:MAG: hypothetical protein EOO77_10795, partial [Oxalobacteraceae bacterium]
MKKALLVASVSVLAVTGPAMGQTVTPSITNNGAAADGNAANGSYNPTNTTAGSYNPTTTST